MEQTESIAVLIPCLNEEKSIVSVIEGFQESLPASQIYVYDNCSSDRTAELAALAGATVRSQPKIGKGNTLRKMFADIEAEHFLLIDGDGTYVPAEAPLLIKKLKEENIEMVVGRRNAMEHDQKHRLGNKAFNWLYRRLFGNDFTDIFSGYRLLSRRFVKSFPLTSNGFEVETEMSVHASQLNIPCGEVDVSYHPRADGSESKLRTFPDGFKVLRSIFTLLKDNRPILLFGGIASLLTIAALIVGIPVVISFAETGLVERLPSAVLSSALIIVALIQFSLGLLLDSVARGRLELKRLSYLQAK